MAGHNNTILACPSDKFLCLAPRKVRHGEEEVRARVCTEAMDFMEGMQDGLNGLIPPVAPNLVSFNIIIKVGVFVQEAPISARYIVSQGMASFRFCAVCAPGVTVISVDLPVGTRTDCASDGQLISCEYRICHLGQTCL